MTSWMRACAGILRLPPLLLASACCGLPLPSGPPPPDPADYAFVAVATRELPAGHDLTADDVELRWVPRTFVLDQHLGEPDLPALRTTRPLHADEALREESLEPSTAGSRVNLQAPATPPQNPGRDVMFIVAAHELPAGGTITENDLFLVELGATDAASFGCTEATCAGTYEQALGCTVQEHVLPNAFVRRASLAPECAGSRPPQ